MKLLRFLKGKLHSRKVAQQRRALLASPPNTTVDPECFADSLRDPTAY